jgi:chemotaxis protein methyltransferase CheR
VFSWVADLARRRSGLALEPTKQYLVETRLAPLAKAAGSPDVDTWVRGLRRHGGAADTAAQTAIVEALTTNETSWLRDVAPFSAFTGTVLPELTANRRAPRRIDVWSAACSSGQEPYSIAMLLGEWKQQNPGVDTRIWATDIDTQILAAAREGRYSNLEVNRGLPAPMLVKHFTRSGATWQISEQLRKQVTFSTYNLITPGLLPGPGQFDVIFCRNVLIYFDLETKKHVLRRLFNALRPGGYLFLGAAETTLGIDAAFERVQVGRTSLYRRPGA